MAANIARSPVTRAVLAQQGPLGHTLLAEDLDVRRPLRWSLVPGRPPRVAAPKGGPGWGTDTAVRVRTRSGWRPATDPGHHGAPVVADQVEALRSPRRRRRPARRPRGRRCGSPPTVRRAGALASSRAGRRPGPGIPPPPAPRARWCHDQRRLGEAVQEEHGSPVGRAGGRGGEGQAAGGDLEALHCDVRLGSAVQTRR